MTWLTVKPNRRHFNHDIDRMFNNFFSDAPVCSPRAHTFWPAVDIHETDDEVRLTLEAPGAKKEDIKVTVKDRVLSIDGKREVHSENAEGNLLVNEIRAGEFSRKFTLPKTINTEKINADFANGLLTVSLAKIEEVKPKEIEVSVK